MTGYEEEFECNVDKLNEWDPKIKDLFSKIPKYNKCVKNEPLTYVINNQLFINQTVNITYFDGAITRCEYATVLRNTVEKDAFALGDFKEFDCPMIVVDDFFKVRCLENTTVKYEYVHSVIQKRKLHDLYKNSKSDFDDDSKINVMILVLDAVSLSSMKRALPKTLEYLKSFDNFFLFEKHHVVGENTFQNLVPMLANLNPDSVLKKKESNYTKKKKFRLEYEEPFDDLPFLWKNFSSNKYLTYFSEEWKECTFNNLKFGFRESPTDYYFRPYWLSLYNSTSYPKTNLNSNSRPCYYNKLLHMLSIDWLKSFEKFNLEFEKENKINNIARFGLVKINEMSHDYLDRLFWIDDDIKNLFEELFTEKFLRNTLFIFMGDHGHRFHPIRRNFVGKMEEKLPMFSMMLPRKLTDKRHFVRRTLSQNTKRLTTWWDVYETLMHVFMDQTYISDNLRYSNYLKNLQTRKNIQRGQSLFLPLSHRSCQQANIPDYLCSCDVSVNVNLSNPIITKAAEFMVNHINTVVLKDENKICMELKLGRVLDAQIYSSNKAKYSIIFETLPNNATFDGKILLEPDVNLSTVSSRSETEKFKIMGKIIRINTYGLSSKCIKKYHLKNFCYCFDYHNNINKSPKKRKAK